MTKETNRPSRRTMLLGLTGGAAALGAVALPAMTLDWEEGADGAESWWDRLFFSLKHGGYDEWTSVVGSSFKLLDERGAVELKLTAVKSFDYRGHRPSSVARDRGFVAVFEAGGAAPAGDRIYSASHSRYGDLQIYMSPSYASGRAIHMEAVFN